jgi:outer membrane receptor for ferrienterochelin and colicins
VEVDRFENSRNGVFDHRWSTPGLFLTTERPTGPVTLSASVRGDKHPDAGMQLTERVAVLWKPAPEWSLRGSAGTGYAPATVVNEETEAIWLRNVRPLGSLATEKSYGSMLDINGKLAGAEVLVTTYASVVRSPLQLAEDTGGTGDVLLRNAVGDMRIGGVEGAAIWRFEGGKFLGTYGYSRGTRADAISGAREPVPMLPRHRLGGDLMFEKEKVYRGGIEGIWYGKQHLDENPYRAESKPYLYLMAIYARQFGPLEAVANFENILNVRQTDTDPLVRPSPGMGGRWTTDVWAPLEGFMANAAIRYRW